MTYNKRELLDMIKQRAYNEGSYVLSSGRTSNYYLDAKVITLHPHGSSLFAQWIVDKIYQLDRPRPTSIGGMELGSIPIAVAVMARMDMFSFIVRKAPKEHGTGNQIEGELSHGENVVIVDDVITTGASTLKAIKAVEERGCIVSAIYALVDRQEPHLPAFDAYKDIYTPCFTIEDLK